MNIPGKHIVSGFFLLLMCAGCCRPPHLSVQTLYFTRESLASYYVETPDPMLLNPPQGQKLLVSWSFPRYFLCYDNLRLNIHIRLRNLQEIVFDVRPLKPCGTYTYVLSNEEFFDSKGILTYKVDLLGENTLIEEWRHQLWHELIDIGKMEDEQEEIEVNASAEP